MKWNSFHSPPTWTELPNRKMAEATYENIPYKEL